MSAFEQLMNITGQLRKQAQAKAMRAQDPTEGPQIA